jgi:glycine/D-amino acid oxidase-like deaminating enzyme/nitrite reductase/ring-hydroxylating ferredoxin subunit
MTFPHPAGNGRESYWIATTPSTSFQPLDRDEQADVVVVGGGITGLTAAYLLSKAGKSVVVVDRERVAMAETGHTTAHLQIVDDTRLRDLVDRFGIDKAKARWDSHLEAVKLIESIVHDEGIRCDFTRLDAYLFTPHLSEWKLLREERKLARKIGYAAEKADPDEIPFQAKHAIRFPDQGKFHPRKYLLALVQRMQQLGVRFYEGTEVVALESGTPATVRTREGHTLTGDWVLETTNIPFDVRVKLHSKLFSYRTYVIGAKVPKGIFEDALYWDTLDPYHYVRVEPKTDHDYVIVGGEDHKVGHGADEGPYEKLEAFLSEATEQYDVVHKWSGEVIETADDYPLIGRIPGLGENELIATGDSGTGMTNGTLAGLMLAERVLGRGTPWDELYDPARLTAEKGPVKEWVRENVDNTLHTLGTLLTPGDVSDVEDIEEGEGAIIRKGLSKYAVARRADGTLTACSAVCTHLGCTVAWNKSEASWDCPCHGSRFTPEGEILHGPAPHPLKPVELTEVLGEVDAQAVKKRT